MSDEPRRRLVRRLALAVGGIVLTCVGFALLALALQPRQFTTHRDAIGYALAQHGFGYQELYITRTWPESLNPDRFAADLDVQLIGGRHVGGLIECRVGRKNCRYSLPTIGIMGEQLPELVPEREQPWDAWSEQVQQAFGWIR